LLKRNKQPTPEIPFLFGWFFIIKMGGMAKISRRKLILQIKQPIPLKLDKTSKSEAVTTEVVTTRQKQDCATVRICAGSWNADMWVFGC